MTRINDKHKDRLFCYIFGREENKKWTLDLFNAMNDSSIENPDDIQIFTIENFLYMGCKNDVAFIIQDVLSSYEQQSSYNPNMPVRQLIYIAKLYEKYIKVNKLNVFSSKLIKLPKPKLVVFYNGKDKDVPDTILQLSDSFIIQDKDIVADVSVNVKMVNINFDDNKAILNKCRPLMEYSWFIDRIRYYSCDHDILESVDKALDDMEDDFQIKAFLIAHKAEVQDMLFVNYDEEETMNAFKKEFYEDGKAEGKADKANEDAAYILKAAEDGLISREAAEMLASKINS